jgi:hypothetical protein
VWDWAWSWNRVIVSLGALAAAAAIFAAVLVHDAPEIEQYVAATSVRAAVEAIVSARTASEVIDLVVGPANKDWLLAAAVSQ